MATYTANYAVNQTLVAATVDTVTINNTALGVIRIVNETGTSPIYVTVGKIVQTFRNPSEPDQATVILTPTNPPVPTVGGQDEYVVPAVAGANIELEVGGNGAIVSLISAGAMAYSVVSADEELRVIP